MPPEPTAAAPSKVRPIHPGVRVPLGDWKDRVLYRQTKRGESEIESCTANAVTILRNDPAWDGVLAWDEFKQAIVCRQPAPWCEDDAPKNPGGPWTDTTGVRVKNWLRRRWTIGISERDAHFAALMVAEANAFDPLIDWFGTLEWDGVPRVDTWATKYLGVDDGPYSRFVGRAFLVSAVARALRPGEKVDTMIVLEGPQGLWKSQSVEALFSREYYSETPLELASKDRFVGLRGLWCHEMAELDGMRGADAGRVKSFLSAPWDKYRPPYGAHDVLVPRRCVMVGTVNPGPLGYLVDVTGNRRIWPLRCGTAGPIDLAGIERDRVQLWAEAKVLFGAGPREGGAKWWPTSREEQRLCNEEQDERMVGDVWVGKIENWLAVSNSSPNASVTVRDVLVSCLGIETSHQDRAAATRVGTCLAQLGWVAKRSRGPGGTRERHYERGPSVGMREPGEEG